MRAGRLGLRLAVLLSAGVLACGGRGPGTGPSDGGDATTPLEGQVFEVVATLSSAKDGGVAVSPAFPPTNTFTVVLDRAAGRMIVGGMGHVAQVPATALSGGTFRVTTRFSAGNPSAQQCADVASIDYDYLELKVAGTTVTGRATGSAQISCGDCFFGEPFNALVTGGADTKAPFLIPGPGASSLTTPFDSFAVNASEPLAPTSKARLVGTDGSTVDLEPLFAEGGTDAISGFRKPDVVLAPVGYTVAVDQLVDFAGHTGASEVAPRLAAFAPFPVVSEDGFESATGASVGGAAVVKAGGPLPPITGAQSVYVGGATAPSLGGVVPGRSLEVRLARAASDATLRLSFRLVSTDTAPFFGGYVLVGSVGHAPGPLGDRLEATGPVAIAGTMLFATPVQTANITLPPDIGDEVLVSIRPFDTSCGGNFRPSTTAVLIDDLRLE